MTPMNPEPLRYETLKADGRMTLPPGGRPGMVLMIIDDAGTAGWVKLDGQFKPGDIVGPGFVDDLNRMVNDLADPHQRLPQT